MYTSSKMLEHLLGIRILVSSILSNSNEKHNHYENTRHYEDRQPSEA